ncbi:MAG: RagB/SusD family nutrient uptake outer membrane protein [Bacteroidetes bacterium]|nr:MAG: RagB/SusD family nutrient uptake outer membrane protein [Bacteroidota bacterium]
MSSQKFNGYFNNWYRIRFFRLILLLILLGCNKNKLNEPQLGYLDENAIANSNGIDLLLIGAYSDLEGSSGTDIFQVGGAASNWIFGSIVGSEAYTGGSDLTDQPGIVSIESFTESSENNIVAQKWREVYDGVARSNVVLRMLTKTKGLDSSYINETKAEALFLRGYFHFEAKKTWNDIPFIDESVSYESGNYFVSNDTTWSHINNDLSFAVQHLAPTQSQPGRVNKYAAEAFLAKAYLFQKRFYEAKLLLDDLISNGETASGEKYALFENYHDNFDPKYKNGPESVFAAQVSVQDNSSGVNGNTPDFLNFPSGLFDNGYAFFLPSQYLVNHFKTNASGIPDLDHFNETDIKNDQDIESSDPFIPYAEPLDPRLDWIVGRRGIPYLDYGIHPGKNWTRNQEIFGPYVPKKMLVSNKERNVYTESNNWGGVRLSANNVNLIRFADVLLWAAETEVEIGSLDQAEKYVNMIRNRAANPSGWVHTYIDDNDPSKGFTNIPAANYVVSPYPEGWFSTNGADYARKAVRYERVLELGMEGHRFYDLVRWGIADSEINGYLANESKKRNYLSGAYFQKGKNEYFPIPQTQIDLSVDQSGKKKLKQNPGY